MLYTIIRMGIAVLFNVGALVYWAACYVLYSSLTQGLMGAVLMAIVGAFINPPKEEIRAALEALHADVERLKRKP